MASLAKYRSNDGLWKGESIWASSKYISASTWWKGLCASEAISSIASLILAIPPSSAASERIWSLLGTTHTKVRNRLPNERVEKLVCIRSNLKLFEADNDPSTTDVHEDSSEPEISLLSTDDEVDKDFEDNDEMAELPNFEH
ncbi:hypothetical protein SNE40_018299 [Patella caerulea]|uniref:HAT C-terminal dimerisation domain-containing protein n=1 Tax=Patella caerulea TaxID=87958 RepID=A0AAN8JAU1_PATCE